MNCFHCGKEVLQERGEMIFIPLDRPYVNLPIHRGDCLAFIENCGREKYFTDNKDKVYDYKDSLNEGKVQLKKRK